MSSNYKNFNQLDPNEKFVKIRALISRTWKVETATTQTIDFILMDLNGEQLHGCVPISLVSMFWTYLEEGRIVSIENFRVLEKRIKYFCPLRHRYNFELQDHTQIQLINENIIFPAPTFDFVEFKDLKNRLNNDSYLTDVIGVFKKTSTIQTISGRNSQKMDIFIDNESGRTLKVTFWDQAISSIPYTTLIDGSKHIVIVTSMSVKEYSGIFQHFCIHIPLSRFY